MIFVWVLHFRSQSGLKSSIFIDFQSKFPQDSLLKKNFRLRRAEIGDLADAPRYPDPGAVLPPCFRNDKGQAVLWLHTSRAQWNKDKDDWDDFRDVYYHAAQDGLREGGNITFEVTVDSDNIDRYIGAFILHDEDENDKMKTNWVGMPKEGCGASNGASGGPSGGPSWGDAKVFLGICQLLNIEFELWYS